jgi:hypothetical protein
MHEENNYSATVCLLIEQITQEKLFKFIVSILKIKENTPRQTLIVVQIYIHIHTFIYIFIHIYFSLPNIVDTMNMEHPCVNDKHLRNTGRNALRNRRICRSRHK